ncbi:hypothetical protein B0H14DRAFT_3453694 [Mycena olivaceomarginata]|nr:hypothetical protein B0H14DRAFT_3453694 [Mycena olivaceomarginata]
MELAQWSLIKYQEEFRATSREEMPWSLVSTAPEVYSVFPPDGSPISDVNYLYENVPHLRSIWPRNYEPGKTRIESVARVPPHLSLAFPERQPEVHPVAFYYSEDGVKIVLPSSIRSSHGAGPSFVPPPQDPAEQPHRVRPPNRSESPLRIRKSAPSPPRKSKHKGRAEDIPPPTSTAPASTSAITGLLGPETRFKKPEDVLIPSSPRDSTFVNAVPGQGLPDPLKGMASSSAFGYGLRGTLLRTCLILFGLLTSVSVERRRTLVGVKEPVQEEMAILQMEKEEIRTKLRTENCEVLAGHLLEDEQGGLRRERDQFREESGILPLIHPTSGTGAELQQQLFVGGAL